MADAHDAPDGNALIDEITAEPTMDPFFIAERAQRGGEPLTEEMLLAIIQAERRARALFIEKDAAK